MTDLMQTLFDYLMEERVPDLVSREYYWHTTRVLAKLESDLTATLSEEQQALLEAYETSLRRQSLMEQEALFRAALALAKELA